MEQLGSVFKVYRVEGLLNNTKSHVRNGKNNRNFHLERVQEYELLLGAVPDRINADWVNAVGVSPRASFWIVTGLEEVHRNRHEIVVHQTAVDREECHQEEHISNLINIFESSYIIG